MDLAEDLWLRATGLSSFVLGASDRDGVLGNGEGSGI
jgi:hypothetical protein